MSDLFGEEPVKKIKRVGYVDADIIAYRACCAAQKEIQFDSIDFDQTLFVNDFETVKEIIDASVNKVINLFNLDSIYLCFSHPANFRKKCVPTYKANRPTAKPVHLLRSIKYAEKTYKSLKFPGLEGDDVCGINCTQKKRGEKRIAISIDKDFYTLPCAVGDLSTGKVTEITWPDSLFNLCTQILMGDAIDGYGGLKGIGKIKARGIVTGHLAAHLHSRNLCVDMINALLGEYIKHLGDTKETHKYFWDNVRCAYILRHGDYNFDTNRVRLISKHNYGEMLKDKKK